jgi:hypothetical protein
MTKDKKSQYHICLVLISFDQLLFILLLFYKMCYSNEEVNRTEPPPSVRVPGGSNPRSTMESNSSFLNNKNVVLALLVLLSTSFVSNCDRLPLNTFYF